MTSLARTEWLMDPAAGELLPSVAARHALAAGVVERRLRHGRRRGGMNRERGQQNQGKRASPEGVSKGHERIMLRPPTRGNHGAGCANFRRGGIG